jgi:PleD family two-component response regulator
MKSSSPLRILYADSRLAHHTAIREALDAEPGGFTLRQCLSRQELERQLGFGESDLVLADANVLVLWYGNEGLGRFDTISRLPVVMLADTSCPLGAAQALCRGASDYLLRPYHLPTLPLSLRAAAGRCRTRPMPALAPAAASDTLQFS